MFNSHTIAVCDQLDILLVLTVERSGKTSPQDVIILSVGRGILRAPVAHLGLVTLAPTDPIIPSHFILNTIICIFVEYIFYFALIHIILCSGPLTFAFSKINILFARAQGLSLWHDHGE